MLAAVFNGNGKLSIGESPLRKIKGNELLVKVQSCGVCGTDYKILKGESHSNPHVKDELKLNLQYIFKNEIQILKSFLNPFTFQTAIDLINDNKIEVGELITHETALKDIKNISDFKTDFQVIKHQVINHNQEER
jgi:threonine dehydrogenase-like Zn-dependent dehydrogenase